MLSRVPSQVAVFASLCTQVSLQQLWSTRHQITFQIRHNATDPGDGLASFPPVWRSNTASSGCISAVHLLVPARCLITVMRGWQCWQGSAEPTTPPGLWAQSLHRGEDSRRDKRRKLNFRLNQMSTYVFYTWTKCYINSWRIPACLFDRFIVLHLNGELLLSYVVNFSDLKSFQS